MNKLYGCIGERLGHSFSKEIHNALTDYEYKIIEVPRTELDEFMTRREFCAINVTIPYKEAVLPHLYYIDGHAREIGAVNTVVNRGGKLYGYNTDFYGMNMLIKHIGISLKDKKVVILGTGGTSKTALAVARAAGAREILRISRTGAEDAITYTDLYECHTDAQIIINTTPSGMYPNVFGKPVSLDKFTRLSGVVDAVYNPLRTPLVLEAAERGIAAEGGLYMLVAQAVRASEIFTDTTYPTGETDRIFKKIINDKESIVLTGMPASGKTTVGKMLAKALGRTFIDTDELIVKVAGKPIVDIFHEDGEEKFRDIEAAVIREIAGTNRAVIATGGGAVLRPENVTALKENGKIFFIDRPLEALIPTASRPLASDRAAIEKRYRERYEIYLSTADVRVFADTDAEGVVKKIINEGRTV